MQVCESVETGDTSFNPTIVGATIELVLDVTSKYGVGWGCLILQASVSNSTVVLLPYCLSRDHPKNDVRP